MDASKVFEANGFWRYLAETCWASYGALRNVLWRSRDNDTRAATHCWSYSSEVMAPFFSE
jgi:hypothetical protein